MTSQGLSIICLDIESSKADLLLKDKLPEGPPCMNLYAGTLPPVRLPVVQAALPLSYLANKTCHRGLTRTLA